MIKELLKSGKTEEEAIKAALDELGLERDDVSVEIIDRAKSGFLGIGAVKAKVKVSYEIPDEPNPQRMKDRHRARKTLSLPPKKNPRKRHSLDRTLQQKKKANSPKSETSSPDY